MKGFHRIFAAVLLICLLAVSASAASGITALESHSTVTADGTCQVSINATVHLDEAVDKLTFPLPADAGGITLNGSRVSAPKKDGVRNVNIKRITGGMAGDYSLHIAYSLSDVIHLTEEGLLQLQVPLLSGFAYPIESMTFSVTLPGAVEVLPSFVSGYHESSIEQSLSFQAEGATVSGSSLKAMKDHETLTMTMLVSEEMFPQSIVQRQDYTPAVTAMWIAGGLAALYFFIFLFSLPTWPKRAVEAPDGIGAGQLGCVVGMQGVDLTAMILSWAQLGYVLITLERKGRVSLLKRMDMGNERSEAERRWFMKLFGKRARVDTSSRGFALLWRQAAKTPAGLQEMIKRRCGSVRIFRALASAIGLFGGAGLGLVMGGGAVLKYLVIILLSVLGAWAGWHVQDFAAGVFLRHRRKLYKGLLISALWLIFGLISGEFLFTLWTVVALLAAGLLLFWGGRRTPLGRQCRGQIGDLKRYLKTLSKEDAGRLSQDDPDYFFRLAPYALALGVDREFARKFGSIRYPACPYFTDGVDANMTALQWNAMLRKAMAAMDERGQNLPFEQLINRIMLIIKG